MIRSFDIADALKFRDDGDFPAVEGRIVPFNEVAWVADLTPDGVRRYQEGFLPGSCTRMEQAVAKRGHAAQIRLTLDHQDDFGSRVGCGHTFEQRDDGAYAMFRLYDGTDLAKVRSMIQVSHRSFSVEFDDVVPPKVDGDVTWRKQVVIPAVTLTPAPAYAGAGVLSMREAEVLESTPALDEAQEWLRSMKGE